jgi:hypothetical protein
MSRGFHISQGLNFQFTKYIRGALRNRGTLKPKRSLPDKDRIFWPRKSFNGFCKKPCNLEPRVSETGEWNFEAAKMTKRNPMKARYPKSDDFIPSKNHIFWRPKCEKCLIRSQITCSGRFNNIAGIPYSGRQSEKLLSGKPCTLQPRVS